MKNPRIRLTISVTPEVHEVFTRMADASNLSLGRAMGDWLDETKDAVRATAEIIVKAKEAPREAIRRINTMTASLVASNESLVERLSQRQPAGAVRAQQGEHAQLPKAGPPSSNTGGKGQRRGGVGQAK